ncbi:MAG: ABC transporter ATP-binding protein [Bacteroidota bacterium]|jgi:ABC-type multidrug transport system ATPase subunit
MESTPVLEIKNLSKKFKDFQAVNDLSFTVNKGDVYGFLGPNGAGKSTTIRMILSLIYPSNGDVFLFGNSIKTHRASIMKKVGAIVERPDFYGSLSAKKNLEILAKMQMEEVSKNRISETLEWVGLLDRADSKVKTFSQGMKQRLGIAQALIHNPELIILDEPTNGLDPHGMKDIREMIISLNRDYNKTIFLSSHILSEVEILANRMIIINKGEKLVEGNVNEILLSGKQNLTVEVVDVNSALSIINGSEYQQNFKSIEKNKIFLSLQRNKVPELNKFLVQNNVDVLSITPTRTLEEFFLSLT